MRCTSCGTENEPDSRFCGGCGAKLALAPAPSRLAPTAKIPDDAVYPPASSLPTGQRPPVGGPASIPPGFNPHAPASIPPTGSRQPTPVPQSRHPTPVPQESFSRAVTPAMQTPPPGSLVRPPTAGQPPTQQRSPVRAAASMGESMPMPARRPVGLMVAILVIDLGLAAAGAVMLGKGLSAKKARKDVAPAAKTEVKSEATPPPAPPTPAPAAAPAATAAAPPAAAPAMEPASATASTLVGAAASDAKPEAKIQPKIEPKKDTKSSKSGARAHVDTAKASGGGGGGGATGGGGGGSGPVTHPSSSPEDPYGTAAQPAFDLAAESSRLASQSNAAFARCASPSVHGTVKIAYHVMPDGSVEHAMAVENTTGDDAVGDCLTTTISTWRYSPHSGQTLSAVRPFNYP